MEKVFIKSLTIENVRHLKNIEIEISEASPRHLILTGKNGSGKTSVLNALSHYLNEVAKTYNLVNYTSNLDYFKNKLYKLKEQNDEHDDVIEAKRNIELYETEIEKIKNGISLEFNISLKNFTYNFEKSNFVLAYYKAERIFSADIPKHVEKINLKDKYTIDEQPGQIFVKYLLDMKVTEALARNNGNVEKADEIKFWFEKFEELLQRVFEDDSLKLIFDEETFTFSIKEENRELFDFNTLSSGFAAVLDIILDIIIRMEKQSNKTFDFKMPGIVLIDEIETHLHLELQKKILDLLTTIFPNIQFIVSTHSPFILNSIENVVIYDLENRIKVEHGLADVPYDGIVEGYFRADNMSDILKNKFKK